ncbi:DUF4139 domain-containing protein [Pseudomarimonas arenosa]|uniref:DUF4139 domain-containing protein n=1 Tax=Pseudomarimonas arenosa TaxID=2774145 RepID=A0AAW3ZMH1_9GAMM|nr:DUF4139 domain-containing protein [Pseudomarimonas arenosa]MBD8525862.1 DUF4139 domain-containing protein [Pseudomarimonas arenosa]
MRLTLAVLLASFASGTHAADPDYSLTVYSSAQPGAIDSENLANYGSNLPGYALVRDKRRMTLSRGRSELRFSDVAARMDPTTVGIASLSDPGGTRVIEQNYQYDLVSGQKLLERFLDQTISVEQVRGDALETISGKLLSAQNGLTLQTGGGELVTLNSWSGIRFPSLPGGLITKPTLVWLIDSAKGGPQDVRVSYQAKGITWWADYNGVLDESQGCRLQLGAWVTLVNQSGGSFANAQLKLVAGEVNRAPAAMPQPMGAMMKRTMVAEAMADEGFSEQSLFEYHLYTLGRRTDLPDNSTKQLELFPAANGVSCEKQLVFTAAPQMRAYYGSPNTNQGYAATQDGTVGVYLEFDNRKENGMGMPLPAGRVRVNQLNPNDGSLEFIGEDLIKHTPRNETLNIKLGEAFDVVGERRQTDFRVDVKAKWMEESFEVSVRNRKEESVKLVVREYLYRWSGWHITTQSHPHQKKDQLTADFPLTIAADGEAKLRYTVRYTW